jgi:hypothetical protein
VQRGDDDRELLSVSLTQSGQPYVCVHPLYHFFFLSVFFRFVCLKIVLVVILWVYVPSLLRLVVQRATLNYLSHCFIGCRKKRIM